jgi:hypothetical protein
MKNRTTYAETTPTRSRRKRSHEICHGDRPSVISPARGALVSGPPDVSS